MNIVTIKNKQSNNSSVQAACQNKQSACVCAKSLQQSWAKSSIQFQTKYAENGCCLLCLCCHLVEN